MTTRVSTEDTVLASGVITVVTVLACWEIVEVMVTAAGVTTEVAIELMVRAGRVTSDVEICVTTLPG